MPDSRLILGIDTCGPSGSVALAHLSDGQLTVLGETPLEGRTYSATLVAAISAILQEHGVALHQLACIVVVSGPGSFTGVRVSLSAAKGLAEGAGLPLVAVSRLAVLAHRSGVPNAAIDAHRHEVFLRLGDRELLTGKAEMALEAAPDAVAVADDAAAALIGAAWPAVEIVRATAPAARDAILVALPRISAGAFDDPVLLDGHYLRRSDAEIFGEPAHRP